MPCRSPAYIVLRVRVVDEPFEVDGVEILYPGQLAGESEIPQHLIWNCRCTLAAWVKGFEPDTVTHSPKMGDMTFEEWKATHGKSEPITAQTEKGEAIRRSYVREYKNAGNGLQLSNISDNINLQENPTRGMPNGLRKSPFYLLSEKEIEQLKEDAESIGIPLEVLSFNTGDRTCYDERNGVIHVRGNVLPDMSSTIALDRMSARAVLAHEYYGHYMTRVTELPPGDWKDEFRASYRAAKYAPNLSAEERQLLIRDAMDRAKNAGVPIVPNKFMRGLLYGIE